MKLLMESWRAYINEDQAQPTVAEFLTVFAKQNPKSFQNVLKLGARQVASIAGGILIGGAASALVGGATGGVGLAGTGAAVAAGTKVSEELLNRIFGRVAEKSGEIANFMVQMSRRQVDDDERAGIDMYYDIDDEYENLIGGIDSELGGRFTTELFDTYKNAFANIDDEDADKPLSQFLTKTANGYFQEFMRNKPKSGVGAHIQKL